MPTTLPANVRQHLNIIGLEHFAWSREHRLLSACASDLGLPVGWQGDRVFDDACDIGFLVRSHHTGKSIVFTLVEESSEVWHYQSYGHYPPVSLTLFND